MPDQGATKVTTTRGAVRPTRTGTVRPTRAQTRQGQAERLDRTLAALERISRALTATTQGVPALLQTIVDTVADVFDCQFVFLVVTSDGSELCAVHPSPSDQADGAGRASAPGRWCVTDQTLLETGSMQVTCMMSEGCPCDLARGVVTIPMSRDGVLEGSISFYPGDDRGLDDYSSSILQILANQATVAVQNAKLFEESQKLREQAEELCRVALDQKLEAERKRRELEMAQDEIDSMEREQIISSERERIARQLHDDVAQILASIGLNVEWCRQQLPAESPVQERLSCLKQLARDGLYEIRRALLGLSPVRVGELGLVGALGTLADNFEHISRIAASVEVRGTPRPFRPDLENAFYHICQEALHNVFKHARAEHVRVLLTFESGAASLTVSDDGIGFRPEDGEESARVTFGLRNMRARAEELGGRLVIEPGGGRGTRVVAHLPG